MRTPSGTYTFPKPPHDEAVEPDGPKATITVRSSDFYLRLLTTGDLGFAEAYMFGNIDIESDDLVNVFMVSFMLRNTSRDPCTCLLIHAQIFIKNKDALISFRAD